MPKKIKLTDEVRGIIVRGLQAGLTYRAAAEAARINERTLRRWLNRGESAAAGVYREFWSDVQHGIAIGELTLLARIHDASSQQWQAAAWLLERRWPERWGRRDRVSASVVTSIARVGEDELAALLADAEVQNAINLVIDRLAEADTAANDAETVVDGGSRQS